MAVITTFNSDANAFKGQYWTNQDWKDIVQEVYGALLQDKDLSVYVSEEVVLNATKQYIVNGLINGKDWKKEIEIADFNPADPDIQSIHIKADFIKEYKVRYPNVNLETIFSSRANAEKFKNQLVETLYSSIKANLFTERMRILIDGRIKYKKPNKTVSTQAIVWDKTITLDGFTDDGKVKASLEKMRAILVDFKTLSKDHTAFTRADASVQGVSIKNLPLEFQGGEFVLVWNSIFWNKLATTTSTLFNKDDVLVKEPKQLIKNFAKVDDITTNSSKMVAFLVHKQAVKEIMLAKVQRYSETLKGQQIETALIQYGHGRLPFFPMVKFVIA